MKVCQHMYEVAEADLQKAVAEEEEENLAEKRDPCTTTKDKQGKDAGGDAGTAGMHLLSALLCFVRDVVRTVHVDSCVVLFCF